MISLGNWFLKGKLFILDLPTLYSHPNLKRKEKKSIRLHKPSPPLWKGQLVNLSAPGQPPSEVFCWGWGTAEPGHLTGTKVDGQGDSVELLSPTQNGVVKWEWVRSQDVIDGQQKGCGCFQDNASGAPYKVQLFFSLSLLNDYCPLYHLMTVIMWKPAWDMYLESSSRIIFILLRNWYAFLLNKWTREIQSQSWCLISATLLAFMVSKFLSPSFFSSRGSILISVLLSRSYRCPLIHFASNYF